MNFLKKHRRTLLLGMADAIAIVCSCLVAYLVINIISQFEYIPIRLYARNILLNITLLTLCGLFGLWVCKVYKNIWRYATIKDFINCIGGIFVGTVCFYILRVVFRYYSSDIFVFASMLLSVISIVVLRVVYFYVYNNMSS